MISQEDAALAAQEISDCKTLLSSDAYARVIQSELEKRFALALSAGRDVSKSAKRRAEYHHCSHVLEELLTILETRLAAAEETLKQWHMQPKSEKYV
jgi:hypothetical protein